MSLKLFFLLIVKVLSILLRVISQHNGIRASGFRVLDLITLGYYLLA